MAYFVRWIVISRILLREWWLGCVVLHLVDIGPIFDQDSSSSMFSKVLRRTRHLLCFCSSASKKHTNVCNCKSHPSSLCKKKKILPLKQLHIVQFAAKVYRDLFSRYKPWPRHTSRSSTYSSLLWMNFPAQWSLSQCTASLCNPPVIPGTSSSSQTIQCIFYHAICPINSSVVAK